MVILDEIINEFPQGTKYIPIKGNTKERVITGNIYFDTFDLSIKCLTGVLWDLKTNKKAILIK